MNPISHARPIVGLIFQSDFDIGMVERELEAVLSKLIFQSDTVPFDYTSYYEKEMGEGLKRRWLAFDPLLPRDGLVALKKKAQVLEGRFLSRDGKRRVNIDPGLLTQENFILATHKNYSHRVYLSSGVFADLTLIYQNCSYQPLPWTYPDYKTPETITMFNDLRKKYSKGTDLRGTGYSF